MPYLTFLTVDGSSVELSGNNENDFKAGAAPGRGLTVRST